ncbi:MAG: hypothetical protein KF855_03820 [Acidobacteria bacterium]|nr:hypothetical protein [Acidobacteriota bacterium]
MTTKWFRRSDGVLFAASEGSATFELMNREGAFVECDEEGNDIDPFIESLIGKKYESNGDSEQSASEQSETSGDVEPSGSTERGGTGAEDQGNDAAGYEEREADGSDLSKESDNKTSVKESSAGSKKTKRNEK